MSIVYGSCCLQERCEGLKLLQDLIQEAQYLIELDLVELHWLSQTLKFRGWS